jgi:hypothetical protein
MLLDKYFANRVNVHQRQQTCRWTDYKSAASSSPSYLFYASVRRLRAVAATLEVDPRMTESSDTSDTPAKPQDYASLRAELAALADDFTPVITELWPRLEDHKYRWELHSYGLAEGYDKLVVSDIIALLNEALKGIGVADNNLLAAHTKAKSHNPTSPGAA